MDSSFKSIWVLQPPTLPSSALLVKEWTASLTFLMCLGWYKKLRHQKSQQSLSVMFHFLCSSSISSQPFLLCFYFRWDNRAAGSIWICQRAKISNKKYDWSLVILWQPKGCLKQGSNTEQTKMAAAMSGLFCIHIYAYLPLPVYTKQGKGMRGWLILITFILLLTFDFLLCDWDPCLPNLFYVCLLRMIAFWKSGFAIRAGISQLIWAWFRELWSEDKKKDNLCLWIILMHILRSHVWKKVWYLHCKSLI